METQKPLAEMVADDVLTGFAKTVAIIDATFAHVRKPEAQVPEYKPEHFDEAGNLTEEGLGYTRGLINQSQALENLFGSYVRTLLH